MLMALDGRAMPPVYCFRPTDPILTVPNAQALRATRLLVISKGKIVSRMPEHSAQLNSCRSAENNRQAASHAIESH